LPFTLHDPNMKEIDYPVGVKPLDFLVSSIEKERVEESVDGLPGTVDYGFNYKGREVTLTFWLRHFYGEHDNRLMNADVYNLLDSEPYFYISHDRLPSRVLKVTIDEQYMPERIMHSPFSELEVKGSISGLPFWETKYTTQDIQQTGFDALVEKYGLADGINIDYPNYIFKENTFDVWNGGNQFINPRNMYLSITVKNLKTSGNFTIENITTGERFIYNEKVENQDLIRNGMKLNIGKYNQLRDSNRKPISLLPGLNQFKVRNGTFDEIQFDFKFYNK